MTSRTNNLAAHLATFAKGYANERTLRTAMAKWDASIDASGLRGNLEVATLSNGRLQPVLVFGPREQVGQDAIALAWNGLPLYQHRADGAAYGG